MLLLSTWYGIGGLDVHIPTILLPYTTAILGTRLARDTITINHHQELLVIVTRINLSLARMVHVKQPEEPAFYENDLGSMAENRFLGFVNKRYIKTFHGALHGMASLVSMILGNLLFAAQVVLGVDLAPSIKLAFFVSNVVSATITMVFFWNKVQAWMLSTTSMKKKGLVARQVQNFNRARGTVSLLNYSFFPLLVSQSPQEWLDSTLFSTAYAIVAVLMAIKTFILVREYQTKFFILYGMFPTVLAVSILWYGRIGAMIEAYPKVVDYAEKQAYFYAACVQFGFMWYFLYSRRLITKEFVQLACKTYHPTMIVIYATQLLVTRRWWAIVPPLVVLYSVVILLLGIQQMSNMIKSFRKEQE